KLIAYQEQLSRTDSNIGIIAPLPFEPATKHLIHGLIHNGFELSSIDPIFCQKDFYKCDAVIASGSLVNLRAAQSVTLPNANLFIDAVDWDYCLNFREQGFEIVVITHASMLHHYAKCEIRKFLFTEKNILVHNYSPLRRYYICRNHTYILRKHAKSSALLSLYISRVVYLIKTILKVSCYESEDKKTKIKACILGTIDGFRSYIR
ncbi:MAG: glycosyltransferase family 2 protein, partial [Limnothrix sp. RL_2_0]|nr:glycosyltransferase family 2 protein [Limnothrix sp. RL_2_0]